MLALCCALLAWAPPLRAQGVEVLGLEASRQDGMVALDYNLHVTLPRGVAEAVQRGVPIYFVAQATLYRPRWYWRDERVARVKREWRLTYQPLTSSWRLGQGGLAQSVASLPEALAAMSRTVQWKIADTAQIDADLRYYIEFTWQLDTSQLPRPLQIGIGGQSDWALGVERSLKLE